MTKIVCFRLWIHVFIRSAHCWWGCFHKMQPIENNHIAYNRTTFSDPYWWWNITHSCTDHLWEAFKHPDVVTDAESRKLTLSAELPRRKHHTRSTDSHMLLSWLGGSWRDGVQYQHDTGLCFGHTYWCSGLSCVMAKFCAAKQIHCTVLPEHAMQLQCTTALANMFIHTYGRVS